jgi:hypothetical protein
LSKSATHNRERSALMTSKFDRQLQPCARNGLSVQPPPVSTGNSSPLISRAIRDKSAPDRMLEHVTQAAFLKVLIAYEAGEASLRLRDDLAKAERERKCIRRAILLTVMLFILSGRAELLCPSVTAGLF